MTSAQFPHCRPFRPEAFKTQFTRSLGVSPQLGGSDPLNETLGGASEVAAVGVVGEILTPRLALLDGFFLEEVFRLGGSCRASELGFGDLDKGCIGDVADSIDFSRLIGY